MEHRESCDNTSISSFLNLVRLQHFTSAEILAFYFGEKKISVLKGERQTYEGPRDRKLAHYQSSPCLKGAVFKYCCALYHCFFTIILSSLRQHQRQRAPTVYCMTTAASLQVHMHREMVVGILFLALWPKFNIIYR